MNFIKVREQAAVRAAVAQSCMPTPSGDAWEKIRAHYKLPAPERVDSVLSRVTLPEGWRVEIDPKDPYKRSCLIKDAAGELVGYTFLKDTGYDYYGRVHFDESKLSF